ncbi:MAG TPA: MFS transporter [Streptosporangiaceae bacterium]|jgi:putative MFS transporter
MAVATPHPADLRVAARIDRLPHTRHLLGLVSRIACGGWFEFYELFMPGYISLGLIHAGVFREESTGPLDWGGFPSFLASFFAGMFVGAIALSRLSDRFGRRSTFTISMVVYSVAALLVAFTSSPVLIDVFRFVAGVGVGVQLISNDTYISELTPRRYRGRYMAVAVMAILTAVPIAALVAYLLVPRAPLGVDGWRWVVVIGALGGLIVLYLRRGLPESPRWLATRGRYAEAERTLRDLEDRVRAETGAELPDPAADEPAPAERKGRWTEMFRGRYLPRTIMMSIFQFTQTIAIFGFTSWVPILLAKQGFTVVHSLLYTFLIAILSPFGALCAVVFAERIERKWQLVGTGIGIGVFGLLFAQSHTVALILLTGGVITLGNNWMIGIFHTYNAEIFPTRIRAQAVGFAFSWSRIGSIVVGYLVSGLLASFGTGAVFAMIAGAMAVLVLSVATMGPRTNGQALETLSD